MKKFLSALTIALLLWGCSTAPAYIIEGSVPGDASAEGKTVYLQKMVARDYVALDSTTVVQGQFSFKGVQNEPALRFITVQGGKPVVFFLENEKIKINLGENAAAEGSEMNKAYYDFMNIFNNQTEEEATKLSETFVKANLNNAVGAYLFHINRSTFTPELQKVIITSAGEIFLNDENVQRIKKRLDAMDGVAIGKKFTDFTMQDPEGKSVSLSDYSGKGQVVMIDFWASWCPPCRAAMPGLIETYNKFNKKGFEIVGVSFDKTHEAWINGIATLKLPWKQMSDIKFWESEGASKYAVRGIPHTVLLDKEGTIVAKDLHGEELEKMIETLLK